MDISRAVHIDTAADFEAWLDANAEREKDVFVGFYKKSSGRQTVTLTELQEVALCFGWVDTHGQRIDRERMALRFMPRRAKSNWSELNRALASKLLAAGRVRPAGLAVLPDDLKPAI